MHSRSAVQMRSGVFLDPFDLNPADMHIEDFAHNCARVPRFSGALEKDWNSAYHALLVTALTEEEFKLDSLGHDLSDGLIGDIASPIKYHPRLSGVLSLEHDIMVSCSKRWSFRYPSPPAVKRADLIALWAEAAMFHHGTGEWSGDRPKDGDAYDVARAIAMILTS